MREFQNKIKEKAAALAAALLERGLSLAMVESLTGGLAMSSIVDLPGASNYFKGGIVSYQVAAKEEILGIDISCLENQSVVSRQCAEEMLIGLNKVLTSDTALSFTGNAGPDPSAGQDVGVVFVGSRVKTQIRIERYQFNGNRSEIREQSISAGLKQLLEDIEKFD